MKFLNLKQGSDEWVQFRHSHVGASDVGTIMEGSQREIYELMQIKRGVAHKYVTDAMKHGTDTEAEAIEWLVGAAVRSVEKTCALMDAPNEWLMASFDYINMDEEWLAEIKCPKVVLDTPQEHAYYRRWWWQVQAQLAVSGFKKGILLTYSASKQVEEWVDRDEEAIARLIERCGAFHRTLVNFEELPAPSEVVDRYDNDALEWASCFRDIDAKIKELEEEKKILRDEGIALAGDLPFACNGVKVTRIAARETIDWEAACKAHKVDVTPFKKTPKAPFTWRVVAS